MENIFLTIIDWCITSKLLEPLRQGIKKIILDANIKLGKKGVIIFFPYYNKENVRTLELIKEIKTENEMLLGDVEACYIYNAVTATEKVKGDIAEIGVYKGGSAKLICETKKNKKLYLFDTFEGLPDITNDDNALQFHKGQYAEMLEYVQHYLKKYTNVFYHKGFFPETGKYIKNKTFSFVHLDVDLYQSTLDCLKFFYPRMNKGSIIICHDYPGAPGVHAACNSFMKNKPEPILVPPGGNQCLIVKT